MYCPKCDMPRPNDPNFCSQCGSPLIMPTSPKKGKLWPPILFLAIMLTAGCVIFALTDSGEKSAPSPTPWFTVEDGTLYFQYEFYIGGSHLEIPSTVDGQTVTALSNECFRDIDEFDSVTLPDTLEAIGDHAFMDCDGLRGIKLSENIGTIGDGAFQNCTSLEAVYIPASVRTAGIDAFSGCNSLRHIFFTGDLGDWMALYPQYIGNNTQIYSVSGPDADSFSPI